MNLAYKTGLTLASSRFAPQTARSKAADARRWAAQRVKKY